MCGKFRFRVAAAILIIILIAASCAACSPDVFRNASNRDKDNNNSSVGPTPTVTPKRALTIIPEQDPTIIPEKTLTIWCPNSIAGANEECVQAAIAVLKQQYPHVAFVCERIELSDYFDRLNKADLRGEFPDLFFLPTGPESGIQTIRRGWAADLSDSYPKYSDLLPERLCQNQVFNGKLYAVPFGVNVDLLFANMDVLADVGYDKIPETISELMDCCAKLSAKGIIPFYTEGYGFDIQKILDSLSLRMCGGDALSAIYRSEATWDHPGLAKAVDIFRELLNKHYIVDIDSYDMSLTARALLRGECAFAFPDPTVLAYISGSKNANIEVSEFPGEEANSSGGGHLVSWMPISVAVSATTKEPELAAEVAFEFAHALSRKNYESLELFPLWNDDDTTGHSELIRKAASYVQKVEELYAGPDNVLNSIAAMYYNEARWSALRGEISGEEFIKKMKAYCR
ncbi:MAG: carbohydrate ABC transporter substrate-binding protein [Lachnospiraceae bacterium]|nr:carbohydrate ABC transporter substrate-binding protein [Lachnospiraceae bacterium]